MRGGDTWAYGVWHYDTRRSHIHGLGDMTEVCLVCMVGSLFLQEKGHDT
jgi:hypothetical protein